MKHRTALIIATALTAFVIVLIGAVAMAITPRVAALNVAPTATDNPTSTSRPTRASTATTTNAPTATNTAQVKVVAPPTTFLSAAQASKLAFKLAPNGKLQNPPELVNYKGRMAYEVLFDVGAVYLDAFNGKVLYSGIGIAPTATLMPPTIAPDNGGNNGGGNGGGGKGIAQSQNSAPAPAPAPARSHKKEKEGGGGGGGGGDD